MRNLNGQVCYDLYFILFYSILSGCVRRIPWRWVRLPTPLFMGFLVSQTIKNLPAMWKTQVPSLGWEDPLEEGMAIHLSILAWRIHMNSGAWRATIHGVTKNRTHNTHMCVYMCVCVFIYIFNMTCILEAHSVCSLENRPQWVRVGGKLGGQ